RPVHLSVHGLHHFGRPLGFLLRPVGDQVEGAQRVDEAPPEITSNIRVIEDAGGHERMSHLQEHRRATTQKRDKRRVAESPDDTLRREIAIPASQSLRMGNRARTSPACPTLCHPNRMPKLAGARRRSRDRRAGAAARCATGTSTVNDQLFAYLRTAIEKQLLKDVSCAC